MWRKALVRAGIEIRPWWRRMALRSSSTASCTVNSMILRSLKDHYLEVSKMTPPPKISPPSPYTVVKGALDVGGPVIKRTFQNEEISISVMRLLDVISGDDNAPENINQLFIHVDISKPDADRSLHFLCGLYPDALGIHSVSLRQKDKSSHLADLTTDYSGPEYEDMDEKVRDALHGYIEERGINESLFPFLQAWLYVKEHRSLVRWFKTIGLFINQQQQPKTDTQASSA